MEQETKTNKSEYAASVRDTLEDLQRAQHQALETVSAVFERLEDNASAQLDRVVAATTEQAGKGAEALRDLLAELDVAVTQARDQTTASCAATIDEVHQTAADTTAHLLATRHSADEHLEQLAAQSASHAQQLRAAFDDNMNELEALLNRKTEDAVTTLEAQMSAVVQTALNRTHELIQHVESDAAAARRQRDEIEQLVASAVEVERQTVACATSAEGVLSEMQSYVGVAGDVIDQVEEGAEEVREFVDSLIPEVEADLAFALGTSSAADNETLEQGEPGPVAVDEPWSTDDVDDADEEFYRQLVQPARLAAVPDESGDDDAPAPEQPAAAQDEPGPVAVDEPSSTDDADEELYQQLVQPARDIAPQPDPSADEPAGGDPVWVALPDSAPPRSTGAPQRVGVLERTHEAVAQPLEPVADVAAAVTVTARVSSLEACTQLLARGAAQRSLRLELVRVGSSLEGDARLRMTTFDPAGWWESHDVVVTADSPHAPSAVVDVNELKQALADHARFDSRSDASMIFDGDVAIGNHLLLTRAWNEVPQLSVDRTPVERIELHDADGAGMVVESQAGRLFLPPQLVACLRRRRASAFDLVTIDGFPYLSAEISSAPEGAATIVAQLHQLGEGDVPEVTERRSTPGTEVAQLISALSAETSPEELARILKVGVGYVRRRAAAHPALSKQLIYDLVRDGTEAMRAAAASNVSIGTRGCELAATDTSPLVRAVIAANPVLPEPMLAWLAGDPVAQVRANAASNPTSTPELLERLAEDSDSTVRAAAAAHERVGAEVLVVLARDPDANVCAAVAQNPLCPTDVLNDLVGIVPDSVLANPRVAKAHLVAGSVVDEPRLRAAVARNPATPPRRLRKLARDNDVDVLAAIADHPEAPKSARRRARQRLDEDGRGYPG